MDKLGYLTFIICFSCVCASINITEIIGPEFVEYGTREDIVFDCDFQADKVKSIVVKWFYNGNMPVYQWIPGKKPSGIGILKGRVDLNYPVTNDSNTMYRALRIFNITTDLTGNYTCKVSGFEAEDSETKQLVIYIPPKSGLKLDLLDDNQTVNCAVQELFPEPEISLYLLAGDNKIDANPNTVDNNVTYQEDDGGGSYNVTKIYIFDNLTNYTGDVKFICDLAIPGTNYSLTQSLTYRTENNTKDAEEYIWNFNATISPTEDDICNTTEGNTGVSNTPAAILSVIFTILTLILCK